MAKKILIADDNFNIVSMVALRLKADGYNVMSALDATQAIALVKKEKPDLVILDINMPAGGGVFVYENLQKSIDSIMTPIIIMSGLPTENVQKMLPKFDIKNFIPKPFDPKEIVEKVKSLIGSSNTQKK